MDIIVRGNPQELDFVRRFCRDKVRRGMLAILPATSPDRDEVVRLKNERDEAFAKLKENEARILDLEEQLSSLIASKHVEDENGIDSSVETVATEMSEASEDNPSEVTEDCASETVTNPEPNSESSEEITDTKNFDVEDLTEINLDDIKDALEEDVKKEPTATRKKSRKNRSQKSE